METMTDEFCTSYLEALKPNGQAQHGHFLGGSVDDKHGHNSNNNNANGSKWMTMVPLMSV